MRTRPGTPYPLGATWDGHGVNFAVFSEHATSVELCLFDSPQAKTEWAKVALTERDNDVWHVYLPDARPGWLYSYRVAGPYHPREGHRFNPAKLAMDPYAKAIGRTVTWDDSMFGYPLGHPDTDLQPDDRDNAAYAPLGMVVDEAFTWGNDTQPHTPFHDTILYEAHVKGVTARHPDVPPELRGTYAGLVCEPIIRHLTQLGVTAVELMPIHQHIDDRHLAERGLSNYWGYNTLSYFAPDVRFASGTMDTVREFKLMVRSFHEAGIEVILDVVYNHTAEGNHLGPTLSLRGVDNASYYRLVPEDRRYYVDYTGCGNTLNMRNPYVLQLIMDSLRYWVTDMHVDGFRFDLASTLARSLSDVDMLGSFFNIIHQDPVISQVKLIAEPWDLGAGGYQIGNFPVLWTEWNGRYRDVVRSFWKGDGGLVGDFATRLAGSSDLYERSGRRPHASINFVTCHDGFTLHDLVSYNDKHNEANGEENRDGCSDNRSWNCGAEGPSDDSAVTALRGRQKRNLMATLLLSQGVPMICGGDEVGRTQGGNNNAYCHDSDLTWVQWDLTPDQHQFLRFVRSVIALRKAHPVSRRRTFFQGRRLRGSEIKDIAWFSPAGHEISDDEWAAGRVRCLGVRLAGDAIDEVGPRGERIVDDTLLLLLNAGSEAMQFVMPAHRKGTRWVGLLDTSTEHPSTRLRIARGGSTVTLPDRSVMVWRLAARESGGDPRSASSPGP